MRTTFRENSTQKVYYPVHLPDSFQKIVWINIAIVFLISLLDLTGWITGIAWLKSIEQYWEPMRVITAVCFIFSALALAAILTKRPSTIKSIFPYMAGSFLTVVSILTIYCWMHVKATMDESSITNMQVLNLFLSPETRMAMLSAFIFLFIGLVLVLLTFENTASSNVAHALFFPAMVASYIVPVSYLLNAFSVHKFLDTAVALNSGIAFCAVSIAVYMVRPDTWLMKVFTSRETGGIMARRLFPWILAFPIIIGWLRIYGEHKGFFVSEVGVLLVAITYTFCFIMLVWMTARSVNLIDSRRHSNEDSLRKSEERYRRLMELSPGASFVNRNNSIVLVNTAARKLLGVRSVEELIGKSPYEIFHPDCHSLVRERVEKLLNGENVPMAEEQIVRSDGAIRDVEVVGARIVDSEGPAIQVIMNDITERKHAEKELFNTKNYLENLINNANAPIIVWDQENKIRLFNHAFENLTGYTSSEVEGKELDILFPKDSLTESMTKIRNALTLDWKTIEIPILTKKMENRIILWNSAKVYNKNRKSFSTIAQGNDITERIKAEEAFRKSREKLEIALENGKIGIWEWDIENDVFNWDERIEKMFGWSPESYEHTFDSFVKNIHEEDLSHIRNAFHLAIKENTPLDTIFRIRHGNEEINYISTKALVEKDKNGKPVKFSGVCFDITEMKKGAEKALFLLNEDLLRSNKELEQFAYVASHDLQEPLRMVSSFTQLLSQRYKDKLDENAQEFIRFAVDGAARMQVLINDLLEYSRIETKGKKFSGVDTHQILGHVVNNLKISIHEKQALITNEELPTVLADEGQMVQLFQNLIGNALKFCKDSPRIHISAREESEFYLFSVRDNGIGIEAQYFNRIFQIFQRLHARDEYGGTGIGLAICKRIIDRHGGKIWVESKQGDGSVFYFTIIKRQTLSNHEKFSYSGY